MKVAVTFEDGKVFQHFGRTEQFKIYEIENGKVISDEIMSSDGTGHEALADLLADKGVNVLICGGMGSGAKAALEDAGLEVYSGQSGEADDVVEAYLKGEIESQGVNCDHHDHEEGHSCGGMCGSCGGCHTALAPVILYEGPNAGKRVKVHYKGTFNDGTQFDSSYDRGVPLEFVCGTGSMIEGFDKATLDMKAGDKKSIHLMPEEAYGPSDPDAIFTIAIADLPGSEDLKEGMHVYLTNAYGQPFPVTVIAKTETEVTFDANSEMAGKELNFDIEMVEIEE